MLNIYQEEEFMEEQIELVMVDMEEEVTMMNIMEELVVVVNLCVELLEIMEPGLLWSIWSCVTTTNCWMMSVC